jgi:putative oxidoreductase
MIMRRIARPMLAAIFISGGIEALRNPKPRIQAAEPVLDKTIGKVEDKLPDEVPTDAETLVKVDAAIKIGAGIALALGKFPRLASLLLAGSLVPTTAAGHRFWEYEDPAERTRQQDHFFKNVSLLGGLMIAAGDTHGKPSVAWRARHAKQQASGGAAELAGSVKGSAAAAAGAVKGSASAAAGKAQQLAGEASGRVQEFAGAVRGGVRSALR